MNTVRWVAASLGAVGIVWLILGGLLHLATRRHGIPLREGFWDAIGATAFYLAGTMLVVIALLVALGSWIHLPI